MIYRLNLLGKANDLADFKYNVIDEPKEPEEPKGIVEIDAY